MSKIEAEDKLKQFRKLRLNILTCTSCELKDEEAAPIYFDCHNPSDVKVLIVTEQPNISCEGIVKAVKGEQNPIWSRFYKNCSVTK